MITNAHNIWDFIGSVSEKTCVINCHPVTYAQAKCAVVCFDLVEFLDAIIDTTPVLKGINLHWSRLGFSKYVKCKKIDHTLLGCSVGGNIFSGRSPYRMLLDMDKSRLAAIYVKHSALVAHSVTFGEVSWVKIASRSLFPLFSVHSSLVNSGFFSKMKPTLSVMIDIEKKFAVLESSLTSLTGQIDKLAKRLDSFMLAVFQPSPKLGDIVIEESSSRTTGGKTAVNLKSFVSLEVKRLKNMLKKLSALVLNLTARFNGSILADGAFPKPFSQ
ncbi:hypothetical protein G9A89_011886 [Geosiphon pyriformis]|nr:hypothetical protein G9A89_011886 [Geosiphon pyriformis]